MGCVEGSKSLSEIIGSFGITEDIQIFLKLMENSNYLLGLCYAKIEQNFSDSSLLAGYD